jgi:hypothetical protein
MKKFIFILFSFISLFVFTKQINAEETNQFATIINPVRISSLKNPEVSLATEYSVIKAEQLSATWLLTFDALNNSKILSIVKNMDKKQELGIFLEVSQSFAEAADVSYHNTGFWHHANSVFLSGYTQEERKLLIDEVFRLFKDKMGYYPTSVGSWWTDSFSLAYMKEKYGITANLGCSDQFSTDGYKIWGQYWSTPFYPSKYHAGIPASDIFVKLDLVTIQWASRDPLNGYYSSLFSTQDYLLTRKNLDFEYFKKLVNLYAFSNGNQFGQITVGLEADLSPETYNGEFSRQIIYLKSLEKEGKISIVNMHDFSLWYRNTFPDLSPSKKIESKDFLGSNQKAIWYQNPNYRIFYTEDFEGIKTIRDFKIYDKELIDPYFKSPNREFSLSIYIPSFFDEISNKDDMITLPKNTEIVFGEKKITLKTNKIDNLGKVIKKTGKGYEINLDDFYSVSREGVITKGFSLEAIHFFKQRKFILYLLKGEGWGYFKKVNYLIPQDEIYALLYLSRQKKGNVAVIDKECLQCEYHTQYKHPAFANLRNYVRKYGKQNIVYSSKITNTDNKEKAKKEINDKKIKYIYLVKFEGYKEKLLFSPGDLGIEKIYDSANAEIWRVK